MGACIPEEYGGAGADFLSYILVLEELSRADAGVGRDRRRAHERRHAADPRLRHRRAAGALGAAARAGRASRRLRPDRAGGRLRRRLAALARGCRTRDGWTITASKQWITNGPTPGRCSLFARTDPETATARAGLGVRPRRRPDPRDAHEEKLGLNSSVTNDIVVEGVHVGRDRLLHEEGRGFRVAMATLDGGRIGIAAQALGIAQAAYDAAREYALERRQFGQRIGEFQAIQHKLANMSTEIDAARLLVYRAAWLKEQGRPHAEAGAKAKLFASEMARRQTARGDPGLRRLRVHEGVPRRALLPRRQDHRDLRGHERDPAARDRALDPRARGTLARALGAGGSRLRRPPALAGQPEPSHA